MIKFVQIGGHLFIGDIQPENPDVMRKPRIVLFQPVGDGKMNVNFSPMIGEPPNMDIHEKLYSYNVTDDSLLKMYIQVTTGLTIPSTSGLCQ